MLGYLNPRISASIKFWTDLPFAVPSLVFVTVGRSWWKARWKKKSKSRVAGQGPKQWVGWSRLPNLADLRVAMIVCPRWNPHALSHNIGPFDATRSISFEVETMNSSAAAWICSIYGSDGSEIEALSSRKEFEGRRWVTVEVEPGQYGMALRYFGWRSHGYCPRIRVDDERELPAARLEPEQAAFEAFLESIRGVRTPFYYFLHCSVLAVLRLRDHLSPDFVRRVYLPFGNLQTVFHFGLVSPGERVQVRVASELRPFVTVFIVFFNDCGFPLEWREVSEGGEAVTAVPGTTSYLTRSYAHGREITEDLLTACIDDRELSAREACA